jgi:hypothetical protein
MSLRQLLVVIVSTLAAAASASPTALAEDARLRDVIDREIRATWDREGIVPAGPAEDAMFLRRVWLDLCGTIPTYDEAVAFLGDASPDKRQKLVDRLLNDPRFGLHQADVWDLAYFTRNPPGYDVDRRPGFQNWLRTQFQQNVPYDVWVQAILKAGGNTVDDGPPAFYTMYRSRPEDANEAITQLFLGVQLQCARCHDHPYEKWTQLDFYGMAAFFARLQVVSVGNKDGLNKYAIGEKSTGDILFTGPAAQQEAGKKGEPVKPKFLLGDPLVEPALPEGFKEEKLTDGKLPAPPPFSRKDQLADWIAHPDNPFFARAVANRVWAQYMGRGLVHPVDNMSPSNTPSHPALLEALTTAIKGSMPRPGKPAETAETKPSPLEGDAAVAEIPESVQWPSATEPQPFNLKWFIRELVLSKTYQLSSSGASAEALPRWFEQARVRPLSAEELSDSWKIATAFVMPPQNGKPPGRFEPLTRDYVVRFFGTPNSGAGDFQGGLQEHLYLNNGELSRMLDARKGSLMESLMQADAPVESRVDRLFLSALGRRPLSEEASRFTELLSGEKRPEDRWRDMLWALLTCSEFRFVH